MIRRPPRSTQSPSRGLGDVYKRQPPTYNSTKSVPHVLYTTPSAVRSAPPRANSALANLPGIGAYYSTRSPHASTWVAYSSRLRPEIRKGRSRDVQDLCRLRKEPVLRTEPQSLHAHNETPLEPQSPESAHHAQRLTQSGVRLLPLPEGQQGPEGRLETNALHFF